MSNSTIQYIIKTCFIHLDDRTEEIQEAIYKFLVFASEKYKSIVLEEAQKSLPKQKFPMLCEQLIKSLTESGGNEGIITE